MYTVIAVMIIFFVLFFFIKDPDMYQEDKPIANTISALLFTLLMGVLATLCIAIASYIIGDRQVQYVYKDQPIVSLRIDKDYELSGSFILGTGSIRGGSVDYYVAYINTPNGYKRITIDAYDSYLRETDNEKPHIKNYWRKTYRPETKRKWLFSIQEINTNFKENLYLFNYVKKPTIIVVPTNTLTINETYLIDR